MPESVINEVLEMLMASGLVSSESEFSRDWLGRSESYMRVLRFYKESPSIASIAICASKLQYYGRKLAHTDEYEDLSHRFAELSEACHHHINATSKATWLNVPEMGPTAGKNHRAV